MHTMRPNLRDYDCTPYVQPKTNVKHVKHVLIFILASSVWIGIGLHFIAKIVFCH